ncbi:pentapeptide repeat-containing protein [Xanthocytophaga agilis]|uniref:Pentapeptide repeat-containing protein n=1 Tax=Xanthocytophaga agilis TaxID=3048010 RepID=A0AAE3R8T3_9BACT|nr:pentapeptide repeat-containing protein [Xanthocytophaga agilis]MDJ1503509.1 pentapeptide repeat-containing protein [Xanthocytophaga agilis]
MQRDLRPYVVRIQNDENRGTGFFIGDDGYILTCSHVIMSKGSDIEVFCYNSITSSFDEAYLADIELFIPESEGDLTLLKIKRTSKVKGLPLMTFQNSVFHDFYTYGFPNVNKNNGIDALGIILGTTQSSNNRIPLFQFKDNALTYGFSGSLIVDKTYGGIIGMAKSIASNGDNLRLIEANFGITSDFIYEKIKDIISGLKLYPAKSESKRLYEKSLKEIYEKADVFNQEIALKDLYTDPFFLIHKDCLQNNKTNQSKNEQTDFASIDKSLPNEIHKIIDGSYGNLLRSTFKINSPQFIFLYGHPGQGKSSFCKRLIYDILNENIYPERNLFFLKLRDVRQLEALEKQPIETLLEEIKNYAEILLEGKILDISKEDFSKSILILDGLDELEMLASFNEDNVLKFCQNLSDEMGKRKDWQIKPIVIITSRYGRISPHEIIKKDIIILQLANSTINQQLEWLKKLKNEGGKTWINEEDLQKYNHGTEHIHIKELIEQPILLNMIAQLNEPLIENSNRALIYNQLFTTLIQRPYDPHGKLNLHEQLKLEPGNLRQLIREIAFTIFKNNREYVHKDQLIRSLSTELRTFFESAQTNQEKRNQLSRLMMSFYMPEVRKNINDNTKGEIISSDYAIEFLHKSLQEYMTAEYIWQRFYIALTEKSTHTKQYYLTDASKLVELMQEIFGTVSLSDAIISYIRDIIAIQDDIIKHELNQRLEVFLIPLIQNSFLFNYTFLIGQEVSPLEVISNCFCGFWVIFGFSRQSMRDIKIFQLYTDPIYSSFFLLLKNNYQPFYLANFSEIKIIDQDLSGITLLEANLSNAYFEGCDLRGCDLRGARLTNTSFVDTNLIGSLFRYSNLESADLVRAELTGADLKQVFANGCNLSRTSLIGADLSEASLYRSTLRGANLTRANLRYTLLDEANLTKCILRKADLSSVNLSRSTLKQADLREAILFGADLTNCILQQADLRKAILTQADLRGAILTGADLRGANLQGADLRGAVLNKANLTGANLTEADFTGSVLNEAIIAKAILNNTDFTKADLSNVDFKDSDFTTANFANSDLTNTYLEQLLKSQFKSPSK